jgi:hypothetical protein
MSSLAQLLLGKQARLGTFAVGQLATCEIIASPACPSENVTTRRRVFLQKFPFIEDYVMSTIYKGCWPTPEKVQVLLQDQYWQTSTRSAGVPSVQWKQDLVRRTAGWAERALLHSP